MDSSSSSYSSSSSSHEDEEDEDEVDDEPSKMDVAGDTRLGGGGPSTNWII
jgi:hypothetical protein